LYVSAVSTSQGDKNLLLVATMADSLFAFDADAPGAAPLWQLGQGHELGTPALSSRNVGGNNGILATPVVDASTGTLFLVSRDCDPSAPAANPSCAQRLFAIEIASGKILSTADVTGSATGQGAVPGPRFDPNLHWSRAALLLQHDRLFVSFGSGPNGNAHEEDFSFHGWLFGYQASDLTQPPSVYCSTPGFGGGAIWQSGNGPAADEDALYFATGNGIHQPTPDGPAGFPEQPQGDEDSVVRLPLAAPVTSSRYWDDRPYHPDGNVFQYMEKNDIDLGTAGPLLIPGSTQLVAGGKSGIVYVLDRATLSLTQDPLEVFSAQGLASGQSKFIYSYDGGPHVHGSPAFVRLDDVDGNPGPGSIFYWPALEALTRFDYDYASGVLSKAGSAAVPRVESGGTLAISADGTRPDSAIVWASAVDSDGASGHLWAVSANTLDRLWDARLPAWAKFALPTVAAGRVYIASTSSHSGSDGKILVFGLPPR
jgi:outer membrane protein assembly factor BamB